MRNTGVETAAVLMGIQGGEQPGAQIVFRITVDIRFTPGADVRQQLFCFRFVIGTICINFKAGNGQVFNNGEFLTARYGFFPVF